MPGCNAPYVVLHARGAWSLGVTTPSATWIMKVARGTVTFTSRRDGLGLTAGPGEFVVLPDAAAFVMSDPRSSGRLRICDESPGPGSRGVTRLGAAHGHETRVLAVRATLDRVAAPALADVMPPVFRLDLNPSASAALDASFALLDHERSLDQPLGELVTSRMSEVLTLQMLSALAGGASDPGERLGTDGGRDASGGPELIDRADAAWLRGELTGTGFRDRSGGAGARDRSGGAGARDRPGGVGPLGTVDAAGLRDGASARGLPDGSGSADSPDRPVSPERPGPSARPPVVDGAGLPGLHGLPGLMRHPQLSLVVRAMHRDLARPWTVAELAREARMSRAAFALEFRRVAGETPGAVLRRWRLARAEELLRETSLALADIATRVGYESGTSLSRAFRRSQGQPPGAWRRERGAAAPRPDGGPPVISAPPI